MIRLDAFRQIAASLLCTHMRMPLTTLPFGTAAVRPAGYGKQNRQCCKSSMIERKHRSHLGTSASPCHMHSAHVSRLISHHCHVANAFIYHRWCVLCADSWWAPLSWCAKLVLQGTNLNAPVIAGCVSHAARAACARSFGPKFGIQYLGPVIFWNPEEDIYVGSKNVRTHSCSAIWSPNTFGDKGGEQECAYTFFLRPQQGRLGPWFCKGSARLTRRYNT